ncbi:MAG: DUF1350 family protein [Chlorobiales bacterium]|jgi:hypothetical protein|nr:DUF1350 family protein [Chlorobiales bacterium]
MPHYQSICDSKVALHPNPIGVVEFYGGQFFGQLPVGSYEYLLQCLYDAGYTLIVVPYQFSTDHWEVARSLLRKRDCVRQKFPELKDVPHFWVGHSLGCKLIALLEASTTSDNKFQPPQIHRLSEDAGLTGILDQPSLLLAPTLPDNDDLIPVGFIGDIMDKLNIGIKPTRPETRALIEKSGMFNLTGIISFASDDTAGHVGSPEDKDVPWLIKHFSEPDHKLVQKQLPGGHLTPTGNEVLGYVISTEIVAGFLILPDIEKPPRELEPLAISLLEKLINRLPESKRAKRK